MKLGKLVGWIFFIFAAIGVVWGWEGVLVLAALLLITEYIWL